MSGSEDPHLVLRLPGVGHRIGREANLLDDRVSEIATDADDYFNASVDSNADARTLLAEPSLGNTRSDRTGASIRTSSQDWRDVSQKG
jgi:hypothetical protein